MALPIPHLLPGEMFFDYTISVMWIGTLANGNQQLPLDTLNGITFPDSTVQTTAATGTPIFPILASDGLATAPSYSFSDAVTTGIYHQATGNRIALTVSGADVIAVSTNGEKLRSTAYLAWVPSTDLTALPDTTFERTGPAAVALGVSGNSTGTLSLALLQIGVATGLSRTASGTVAIGNGTAGDFSGQLQVSQIADVTDIWTAGVSQTTANSALHTTALTTQVGVPTTGSVIMAVANATVATFTPGLMALTGATANITFASTTGLSRVSSGTLALGNGTTGDVTGQLQLNSLADVASIWTSGVTQNTANAALHLSSTVTQVGVPSGGSIVLAAANTAILTVASGVLTVAGNTTVIEFAGTTGLSRVSSGTLALGNGTTGDVTGQLQVNSLADVLDIWGPGVTQNPANSSLHIPSSILTQVGVPTGGTVNLAVSNAAVLSASAGLVALTGTTINLTFGNNTGISRIGAGSLALGNGTTGDVSGILTLANTVLTAVAPTVAAAQVGLGSTTATTVGAAGGASALPATPTGYLIINVAGTKQKVPYYAN